MTVEQLLLTAVGVLGGIIVTFAGVFRQMMKDMKTELKELDKKNDECERDRIELWKRIAALESFTCDVKNCKERHPLPSTAPGAIQLALTPPTALPLSLIMLLVLAVPGQSQWVPDDKQAEGKRLWEESGVPWVEGLKFYELPIVSQRLSRFSHDVFGIFRDTYGGRNNVNQMYPWATPSGLHYSPRSQWRKLTAAYFPSPPEYYYDIVGVFNGSNDQDQTRVSWTFPDGTMFAEMLIRTYAGGLEWPFEIRVRTKGETQKGKWDDGAAYRPYADAGDIDEDNSKENWELPPGKLSDFGMGWFRVSVHKVRPTTARLFPKARRLVVSRVVISADHDHGFVPKDYMGTMMACSKCHDKAGAPTRYGSTAIRGSDTVLSWHPFTMDTVNTDAAPRFDTRWAKKWSGK